MCACGVGWYVFQLFFFLSNTHRRDSKAADEIDALVGELRDVEDQLLASLPLIKFMENAIRLGDLYAGDEALFSSEFKRASKPLTMYHLKHIHIVSIHI